MSDDVRRLELELRRQGVDPRAYAAQILGVTLGRFFVLLDARAIPSSPDATFEVLRFPGRPLWAGVGEEHRPYDAHAVRAEKVARRVARLSPDLLRVRAVTMGWYRGSQLWENHWRVPVNTLDVYYSLATKTGEGWFQPLLVDRHQPPTDLVLLDRWVYLGLPRIRGGE